MQKSILKMMALLIVCLCYPLLLCSCGSDDDDDVKSNNIADKLQGTWIFEKMKTNVLGQTIEMTKDELKSTSGYDEFYDDVLTFKGSKVNGLEYTLDGNKILLPWYADTDWWEEVSFSGSKMIMYLDEYYEGIRMQLWLTYKKSGSRAEITRNVTTSDPQTYVIITSLLPSLKTTADEQK